jgi:endoglucanase
MKKSYFLLMIFFLAGSSIQNSNAQQETKYHAWWNEYYPSRPLNSPDAKKLSRIKVKANQFVDEKGNVVLFRGLSISDPDKLEHQGHWNSEYFMKVKEMGTMLVRIPVHPVAWKERTPANFLKLLDQAVEWCTDLGMYIIIDWHSIGNLEMEMFQDPMYNTTKKETYDFWRTIASHFKGNNTVAFYELYNEPTVYRSQLGQVSWSEWKKINENMISIIRGFDKEVIPLVAGFDWAYDLTPLLIEPIAAEGIGYVTHPYANKRSQPWEPKWEENFGFAAEKYPIIATEIGFSTTGWRGEKLDTQDYGNRIVTYLENRGISWMAWVFDAEWYPKMLESWDTYKLTECGEFFKKAMHNPSIKISGH